jgi:TonB family protein
MTNDPLSLAGENEPEFRRNFVIVFGAHLLLVVIAWVGCRLLFKRSAPEPITWLDGGGELGSAAALPLPQGEAATPAPPTPEPVPEVVPPPPDPLPPPKELSEMPLEKKATPTPTPKPRPKPTPTPTPKPKPATPAPKPKPSAGATPTPSKKSTPAKNVAKLATPRPGAKAGAPKIVDSSAKATGAGTGEGNAPSGTGKATNAGTKGGPGAAGGSDELLAGYFKKVETQFHREWEQPLTVVRSGRDVEAHVRLRAAADGTVESLTLVKPTGNSEVDQSIEQALRRVKKVERPPKELLKNGVLDELVAFILEL